MARKPVPNIFQQLLVDGCIKGSDIVSTQDGFFMIYQSLATVLAKKGILDFPDSTGQILPCSSFYDDWYLYAVPDGSDYEYSLLKLREQEHDAEGDVPADGDTPGVTICFISFSCDILLNCLADPINKNRQILNSEINRVVVRRGQHHHYALKRYFIDPDSEGAYLVADLYTKYIASLSENGCLKVPDFYKDTVQRSISYKSSAKYARLPRFIESLNQEAGYVVCNNKHIFIKDPANPNRFECAAILATHAGNTSVYSFAAEVEYHARFLTTLAKIKLPFFGRSIYDSAIRADMTVGDTEFDGPAPFYKADSKIVKRQYAIHHK